MKETSVYCKVIGIKIRTYKTIIHFKKKVSNFPVPSRDVTKLNYFPPGRVWLVTFSDIPAGDGKIANLFLQCIENENTVRLFVVFNAIFYTYY
jgi:hypothetical protein